MIQSSQFSYKLTEEVNRINYIQPAYDDSVVMTATTASSTDALYHFNRKGQLLYKHDFGDFVDSLVMPDDHTAVVAVVNKVSKFYVFNLKAGSFFTRAIQGITDISCDTFVDFFPETQMVCFREELHHLATKNHSTLKISYFSWPFSQVEWEDEDEKEKMKPWGAWVSKEVDWEETKVLSKVNDHSRYVWFRQRQKGLIEVKSCYIDQAVRVVTYSISTEVLSSPYMSQQLELAINYVWEWQPMQLLLGCNTNKNNIMVDQAGQPDPMGVKKEVLKDEEGEMVINNNFVWDIQTGTVRELGFTLGKYQDLQVDLIGNRKMSVFPTFYFEPNQVVPSPIHVLDNRSGKPIWSTQHCISHKENYNLLDYKTNTIIKYDYNGYHVNELTYLKLEHVSLTEMSLFVLLNSRKNMDQPIDDNLLTDIIEILDYEEEPVHCL